jgi:hypothetical protein
MSNARATREAFLAEVAERGADHAAALHDQVPGYGLDFAVENIISLQHNALAGGRLRRMITPRGGDQPLSRQALSDLDTASLARIDMATLSLARDLLEGPSSAAFPLLRTPVALQTLGHSSWRAAYVALLRQMARETTQRIAVELVNLDEGTPAIRVGEATMLLAGLLRGVLAFTDPTSRALAVLRDNRLLGVTVSAEQLGRGEADRLLGIAQFALAARRVAPTSAICGRITAEEVAAARRAGVTYLIEGRPASS